MLNRERGDAGGGEGEGESGDGGEGGAVEGAGGGRLDPLYRAWALADGAPLWYSRFLGRLSLSFPRASGGMRGGILADEMGLGKTVEVAKPPSAAPSAPPSAAPPRPGRGG